jgi:hypothetical protein
VQRLAAAAAPCHFLFLFFCALLACLWVIYFVGEGK